MFDKIILQARLTWRLLFDSRVPITTKIIPIAAILYVLSPFDLIPDVFLVLGQLDDIGILLLSMRVFIQNAPADIVAEHRAAISGNKVKQVVRSTANKVKRKVKKELG
jgi:uncharacterized membrane protein YkvA (DUF1232 family)